MTASGDEVVVVLLDGVPRGLPVSVVREVLPLGNLTPVPSAPAAVCGVTQVRGQVVPVIDLAETPRTPRSGDPLVVIEVDGIRAALVVDRALGVSVPSVPTQHAIPLDVAMALAELKRSIVEAPGA